MEDQIFSRLQELEALEEEELREEERKNRLARERQARRAARAAKATAEGKRRRREQQLAAEWRNSGTSGSLDVLSDDTLADVASKLPWADLLQLSLVSRRLRRIVHGPDFDAYLWEPHVRRVFGALQQSRLVHDLSTGQNVVWRTTFARRLLAARRSAMEAQERRLRVEESERARAAGPTVTCPDCGKKARVLIGTRNVLRLVYGSCQGIDGCGRLWLMTTDTGVKRHG